MKTLTEASTNQIQNIEEYPKDMFMQDAQNILRPQSILSESKPQFEMPDHEFSNIRQFEFGVIDAVESLGDLPEQVEIFGKRIDLGFSEYFGADEQKIERKASNLITAERNLLSQQQERYEHSSRADLESLPYAIGAGAVSYGSMLFSSGAGALAGLSKAGITALGIGTMATMELGSEVSSRTPITEEGELDIEAITPEWARKSTGGTIAYLGTSAVLEKKIGFGSQLNVWGKPLKTLEGVKDLSKTIGRTALSEGTTEYLQGLSSAGIRYLDDTISLDSFSEETKGLWKDFVVGSVLGATSGTAVALNQRANIKQAIKKEVLPVIQDEKVADEITNAIFEEGNSELTTVISKELELSSELQHKHGIIYENMGKSINEAIIESGAFTDVSEIELAEYVSDTSRLFADQVLAEANKRGVLIDGVLKGSEIKYEDGKIRLINGENTVAETFKQDKKGAFSVSEKAVQITENADFSTLPHELSHFWLDNIWEYTRTGQASPEYMKNFSAVKNWLDIKDNQKFLTRKQQEKFARGYEKYLTKGTLPNRMVGDAFDNYDKWLQKVYNSSSIKTKLTPEAIGFFQTMTTGELLEPDYYEPQQNFEKRKTEKIETVQKETQEVIKEKSQDYNRTPVVNTTEYEKGKSSVFGKHAEKAGSNESLEYDVANLEKQNKLAKEYVENNPKDTKDIIDGRKDTPKNILKNAIYNAYLKQMLDVGNTEAYLDALRTQSLELTRAGQEISSQRGVEDIMSGSYWIKQVEQGRKLDVATKSANYQETLKGDVVKTLENKIDNSIDKEISKILRIENSKEQQKAVNKLTDKIAKDLGVKPDELFQAELEESLNNKNSLYNYIKKETNQKIGVSLTQDQANEVLSKVENIKKNAINSVDKNGNPTTEYFKQLGELEDFANSLNPTSQVTVLTSIAGRGAMLASLKSPLLNIESNILNTVIERINRKAVMKLSGEETENLVSKEKKKEYMEYSKNIYNVSGYSVSNMEELSPIRTVRGEKIEHSQGEGIIRKLGRLYENTVFKYSMGYPDVLTKDFTFVDVSGMEATNQAKKEGAKDVQSRADEIFDDIIKIEPETDIGKEIRIKAIEEARIVSYTNDSALSKITLSLRDVMNKATGQLKAGNLISPFVKTPANVYGLGMQYTFGLSQGVLNAQSIYNDIKDGRLSEKSRSSINASTRNVIGFISSAMILSTMIDEEDYIPDYSLLTPSQRDIVKAKNGVFNSIKVGDKYVSLDYFGPLAIPLVSMLEARRRKGVIGSVTGYGKGAVNQLLAMPVVGDLKDVFSDLSRRITEKKDTTFDGLLDWAVDFTSARTIPAFVNDIAKTMDEYERDTMRSSINRVLSKLPIVRETLPIRKDIVTGEAVKTPSLGVLFGSRVKEVRDRFETLEIDRLKSEGISVSISDPTRYGDLKELSEELKARARQDFADIYSTGISKVMEKPSWDRLEDSEKAKKLNKIRKNTTDKIKEQYLD